MILASFPSPDRSVWDLGPIPIRAYALCIIAGIIAAIWIGERRWVERGGRRGTVSDIAVWAVIAGLIGGRLYHVITDNELYFRAGRDPWRAFYVWEGGLGIWGAVALGALGAWIACRRRGIKLPPFADAVAPAIVVAQGLGRWGNYFNQELFGKPTDLPWAVEIDPDRPSTIAGVSTYHPTFLYESLWDMALAVVLILADRRWKMGRGRVFALYVMGYCVGRVWIELLRIDTANEVGGLRINVWTSIVVFAGGLVYFLLHRGPRETEVEPATPAPTTPTTDATADPKATDADDADTADAEDTTPDPDPVTPKPVAKPATDAEDAATAAETSASAADAEATAAVEPVGGDATGDDAVAATAAEDAAPEAAEAKAGGATKVGDAELTAEEQVAATATDEPLTVEKKRRLLPAGRRKR